MKPHDLTLDELRACIGSYQSREATGQPLPLNNDERCILHLLRVELGDRLFAQVESVYFDANGHCVLIPYGEDVAWWENYYTKQAP